MNTTFKQGIIKYPTTGSNQNFLQISGDNVSLLNSNGSTLLNFAHGLTNYIFEEFNSITNAWVGPFTSGNSYWLYWNIDTLSGVRTFGYTTLTPITATTAPTFPSTGQHWYDSVNNKMFVWETSVWRNVIRVFACQYNAINFSSVGLGVGTLSFAGTQVGISSISDVAGKILFFDSKPVLKKSREFFTTESIFNVNGSNIDTLRLEASYLIAKAEASLAKYKVIKYTGDGLINYADYADSNVILGMVSEDVTINELTNVILDGQITNPLWSWSTIGQSLWVNTNGDLVTADPYATNNTANPVQFPPIAKVLSPNTIIFDPSYSTTINQQSGSGSSTAIDTTFTSASGLSSTNVKTALDELNNEKANLTGATFTGTVLLDSDPTGDFQAVTKRYVDNINISDIDGIDPTLNPIDNHVFYYQTSTNLWKSRPLDESIDLAIIDGGTF